MKLLVLLLSALVAALPVSAGAGEPRTVTLDVARMVCPLCPASVKKALMKVPGVQSATVDFESKTAVVSFDPDKASIEALTKATASAGFPSSPRR